MLHYPRNPLNHLSPRGRAVSLLLGLASALAAALAAAPVAAQTAAPPYATYLKDAKSHSGLLDLHQKESKIYGEFSASHLGNEYIVLISISRGIGQGALLGGMSWGFGDDWVWQFRKVDENIHIIRKNVRFKAASGTPEALAVRNAYNDSVLFTMPILTKGPKGGDLVDLTPVFFSDLPQISQVLPGFTFSPQKSTLDAVKPFRDNVELQIGATYASSGAVSFDSVPDSRGVTIGVHYSISKIPTSGYTPRLADDRVGYFLTVVKDYTNNASEDRFLRYINRWKLEKAVPTAKVSAPKEPVVFWLEKTIPYQYRKPIRDGILEWNKAFAAAGFHDAIEVRQQDEGDTWDPEDVNYNTFRWITSSAGFAMGPSRVNPYTGQILDADIIFDADFLTFWKQEFETLNPQAIGAMTGGWPAGELKPDRLPLFTGWNPRSAPAHACQLTQLKSHQFAFGAVAALADPDPKVAEELQEKLIIQGLKEVTMHEVGHTLGLRHNFKASTQFTLAELNDPEKTKNGIVASVMDYSPTNIVPKGMKQGDFYTQTVGLYDVWAIQYGYTQLSGGATGEVAELKKIASRSGEAGLDFATDEDTTSDEPDPRSNRFDLGKDPVEYAKARAELVKQLIPGLADRVVKDGENYTKARQSFNILLSQYGQSMYFASRVVGGLHLSRSHKGDKDAAPPVRVIDAAKGREALALLEEHVFSDKPFQFPPELYNQLAATTWRHWGLEGSVRKDFPVHDVISQWQERVLAQLLSPVALERMHDAELKVAADADALTVAELLERLTKAVFSDLDAIGEGDFTPRKPAVSSLRRNLQRIYLERLANLAMGRVSAPEDCQTLAFAELSGIEARMENVLKGKAKLDAYTKAHLQESASRARKVLDARLSLTTP